MPQPCLPTVDAGDAALAGFLGTRASAGRLPPMIGMVESVPESRSWHDRRRTFWQDFWDDGPSWLASLVGHLMLFLVIASMSSPNRSVGGRTWSVTLTGGFSDSEENQSLRVVEIPQTLAEADGGEHGQRNRVDAGSDDRIAETAASIESTQEAAPPRKKLSLYEEWKQRTATRPLYSSLAARSRREHTKPVIHPSMLRAENAQQQRQDQVVDRFILYDTGQLRGADGLRARREFMALGPDAVPALVRGLNKSANLHASCPVGVIAGKLMTTLSAAQNPSLVQYALDNIGFGVAPDAPHYTRIIALRDQWLANMQALPSQIADTLARRGISQDGQMVEICLSLSEGPSDTLLAALDVEDHRLQTAAMVALMQRSERLSGVEQNRLRQKLKRLEVAGSSDDVRALAKEASTAIASRNRSPAPQTSQWNRSPATITGPGDPTHRGTNKPTGTVVPSSHLPPGPPARIR